MNNVVEQTNVTVNIETDAPAESEVKIFAVSNFSSTPDDKVLLGSYTQPTPDGYMVGDSITKQNQFLNTSDLTVGNYRIEVWSNFDNEDKQQHLEDNFQIINSKVI